MGTQLHTLSDMAHAAGRFEMHRFCNQPNQIYQSLLDLPGAMELGLFAATAIFGSMPAGKVRALESLCDSLGARVGNAWHLNPPVPGTTNVKWQRLLKSDVVLTFLSPEDPDWIAHVISKLHAPFVATLPLMSLDGEWGIFMRKRLADSSDCAAISVGCQRAFFCVTGNGPLFTHAIDSAELRPPLMWGYPADALRAAAKSRKYLFRRC